MRGPTWRGWPAAALVALALSASLVLATAPDPTRRPLAAAPSSDPAVACQDLRAGALVACLHGNDTPPPGVSLFEAPSLQELEDRTSLGSDDPRLRGLATLEQATEVSATANPGVPCIGNGTSGKRIQAIYARAADKPDNYSGLLASLRQWAAEADQAVWASAGLSGGARRLRFVTSNCLLDVDHVVLTSRGDDDFGQMRSELRAKGYTRSDRKYLVWMDASVGICGLGEVYGDRRPGLENYNNGGPMYARVDRPCWQYAELHEIFHTLGAVQPDAPHPSAASHCTDEADVMCYDDDGSGPVRMTSVCPPAEEALLDCGDDDYFATDPPAGSYLASNWNTADSGFLQPDNAPLPAQLSLSATATITYGSRARLGGRLADEQTGNGLTGEPVNLFGRRAGTSDEQAAGTVTSAGNGAVSFSPAPVATTAYRASYPGGGTYGIADSARVTVGVRTRVSARRSASTVRAGGTVRFAGTVGPNHQGQRVYLQRLVGGHWRTLASTTLSSASAYRLRVRFAKPSRLTYRVRKPADHNHLTGDSASFTITVR